ncbi:hybrid sensor histidine kinase/response regulator [Deltaproteobacteria bacterium TL4]
MTHKPTLSNDPATTTALPSRILVVDDELDVRKFFTSYLQRRTSYQVESAVDGREALEKYLSVKASDQVYHLLLVDLNMPRMDGETLIREIRKIDTYLAIIVLTGHGDLTKAFELLKDCQIFDYLTKPVHPPEHLLFSIESALDKQRLLRQNQELWQLDRMKDDLTAMISHEFRTPLTSIIGYTEALRECPTTQVQQQQFLAIIFEEAERLERLVKNILEISHFSQGKLELQLTELELEALLQKVTSILKCLIFEKEIILEWQTTPVRFEGDADRMEQVLINLLDNAIKFSPKRGRITLCCEPAPHQFKVSIQDQGQGIAEDELEKVFTRYYQSHRHQSEIKGNGLGLSIAKYIIDAHQGVIWAENIGKGAKFCFTLPLKQTNIHHKEE